MSDETSEEEAALDDAIPDRFGLETAEEEAADEAALKQGRTDVGEGDIIAKARARLYREIDTMTQKDVLAIYVSGSRLEEARLRAVLRKKAPDGSSDADDLRKKAGAAIRAARGGSDDHEDGP